MWFLSRYFFYLSFWGISPSANLSCRIGLNGTYCRLGLMGYQLWSVDWNGSNASFWATWKNKIYLGPYPLSSFVSKETMILLILPSLRVWYVTPGYARLLSLGQPAPSTAYSVATAHACWWSQSQVDRGLIIRHSHFCCFSYCPEG